MILYTLQCTQCHRSEPHGFSPPVGEVQRCITARDMRRMCREPGCNFEVVSGDYILTDIDRLRLGMAEDRRIA